MRAFAGHDLPRAATPADPAGAAGDGARSRPDLATARPSMPHLPQLDGVRAVAVTLVVLAHAGLEAVVPGGLGVTIFFFLSGYLITTLLRFEALGSGGTDLRAFYRRRVLRICPPLYLTLAFAGGLAGLGILHGPYDPAAILAQATFLTNYAKLFGAGDGLPLPLWSLAVEEHFYLLFPLGFALWFGRAGPVRAAALCGLACGGVLAVRSLGVLLLADASDTYIWTHTRIDSILFGCCLALWRNPLLDGAAAYRPAYWQIGAALAVLLATLVVRDETFRQTLRYTLQGGALVVLFAAILAPRPGLDPVLRLLASPVATRVGLYSYTIYLVHAAMIEAAAPLATSPLARGCIGIGLTLVYADLMYRCVERPAARLRRRLDVPRARAGARAAVGPT